jgi:large subunit ribosomal protein L19
MDTTKLTPVNIDARKKLNFKAGDTIRVQVKIQEKGKTRLQAFEGLVLSRKHGAEAGATFTVRKVSNGVGVERIFPLYSPIVDSVELVKKSNTRRSKLYFLRDKTPKQIRRKLKSFAVFFTNKELEIPADEMMDEVVEEVAEATDTPAEAAPEAKEEKKTEKSAQ